MRFSCLLLVVYSCVYNSNILIIKQIFDGCFCVYVATGAMAVFIVYDITDKVTWKRAKEWMNYVRDEAKGYDRVLVIGNKKDLADKREISYEEANNECMTYGFNYMETSAKDGTNILTLQKWLDSHTANKVQRKITESKDDGRVDLELINEIDQEAISDLEDKKCTIFPCS